MWGSNFFFFGYFGLELLDELLKCSDHFFSQHDIRIEIEINKKEGVAVLYKLIVTNDWVLLLISITGLESLILIVGIDSAALQIGEQNPAIPISTFHFFHT